MKNNHIGLSFEIAQKYTNSLKKIFESINLNDFTWYVADSENYIVDCDGKIVSYLPDGIYSGIDFKREINRQQYYIHLLSLYGVPREKEFYIDTITTYIDYVNSNAEIALFCGDGIVDLYVKNQGVLDSIKSSCVANNGNFIENKRIAVKCFTEKNDKRTAFHV